jgi:hypothetical protein
MIGEDADGVGITEVDANADARIEEGSAVVVRDVDGVADEVLLDRAT